MIDDIETCQNCGQVILLMCQHMTGFCCQLCENDWKAKNRE